VALFEFLPLDDSWSQIINRGAQEVELIEEMRRRSMPVLLDDAMEKLGGGVSTFEEINSAVAVW
jgi:type II secretory ATPase GspE/PulE/Tfp pilus assembly ATPase PilB-like protein